MASRRRQDRARDPAKAASGRRARTLLVVRCPVAERKESRARDRQRESEATRIMRPHPRAARARAREFPPPPPPALARAAPLCGAGGVEKHRKVCRKHDAQTQENIRNHIRVVNSERTSAAPGFSARARPRRANCVGVPPFAANSARGAVVGAAPTTEIVCAPSIRRAPRLRRALSHERARAERTVPAFRRAPRGSRVPLCR